MKNTTIIFLLIILISSCNINNPSESSNKKNINPSMGDFLGAWKYDDSINRTYIQFENDGILKGMYSTDNEVFFGKWKLHDNILNIDWDEDISLDFELLISDFDGNSFKSFDSVEKKLTILHRLTDEAGEPILHYSRFEHIEEVATAADSIITCEEAKSKGRETLKSIMWVNDEMWDQTKTSVLVTGNLITVKWTNTSKNVITRFAYFDSKRGGRTEEFSKYICNDNSGDYFEIQGGMSDIIYFYNELGQERWSTWIKKDYSFNENSIIQE
jgi:hypothetical protein